ncbi:MAG: 30S ribosomal protein S4 [Nanobdellota archaeon]
MGDPKRSRKKYDTPRHPWMKSSIDEEKTLKREYGFKNKKELWKASSLLKSFFLRAKRNAASLNPQSEKEQEELVKRLQALNLVKSGAALDDILGIDLRSVLERRLQTLVYKKGLARSIKQARQLIAHGHIMVGRKTITSPSYLVTLNEEGQLRYVESSPLADENHPERFVEKEE